MLRGNTRAISGTRRLANLKGVRLDHFLVRGADAWAVPVRGAGSDHQSILVNVAIPELPFDE